MSDNRHYIHQPFYAVAGDLIDKGLTWSFDLSFQDVEKKDYLKHFPEEDYVVCYVGQSGVYFLTKFGSNGYIYGFHNSNEKSLTLYGYYSHKIYFNEAYEALKNLFPKKVLTDTTVPMDFWHSRGTEGHRTYKKLNDTLSWDQIKENYDPEVAASLEKLMKMGGNMIGENGRLILWRGEPGTGKTHAIRALTREWKSWCNPHYIIDPEQFFNQPAYMLDVLLRINEAEPYDDNGNPVEKNEKWNLIILEDAGELIVSDAKSQVGPALSKLLNIGDGMLGQGMRLLILITTNEDNNKLDKAISRNGRCMMNILFKEFNRERAIEWLNNHGANNVENLKLNSYTISDLYAELNKAGTIKNDKGDKKVGFLS